LFFCVSGSVILLDPYIFSTTITADAATPSEDDVAQIVLQYSSIAPEANYHSRYSIIRVV
jgi:hypothetical protein